MNRCFLLFLLASLLITGGAFAQPILPAPNNGLVTQPDSQQTNGGPGTTQGSSFQVVYANNQLRNGETIKTINTGSAGGVGRGSDICVNVYVFDTAQNMQQCCTCLVSPDGLGQINITGSTLATQLVTKLVSTYPANNGNYSHTFQNNPGTLTCDASVPATGYSTGPDGLNGGAGGDGTSFTGGYMGPQQYLAPGLAAWLILSNPGQIEFHQSTFSLGEAATLAYGCGQLHSGLGGGSPTCSAACGSSIGGGD